jgi:hypothetical protein
MQRILTATLAALFTLLLPLGALAMSHEKGENAGHDHGKMEGMKQAAHGTMKMEGDMAMLGEQTEDGVKATAHLKDVKAAMAKMGMSETHHFMVMFMDTTTGKPIESGTVAVKIKGPKGEEGKPVELMGMDGHFGADIALNGNGEYEFKIGTKLPDGKKRQFEFKFRAE